MGYAVRNAERGGDVVHSLEAAPQGLGSRLAIGFAGEEAAELGDGANHLPQRRWLLGRWLTGLEDVMTAFHWSSWKATVQGRSGRGAAQPGQTMAAPGHDGIDGQAGFQTVCGADLAILDLTAALE
jgi:hypothetical protein